MNVMNRAWQLKQRCSQFCSRDQTCRILL